jgi:hypothetical protein
MRTRFTTQFKEPSASSMQKSRARVETPGKERLIDRSFIIVASFWPSISRPSTEIKWIKVSRG